MPSWKEVWSMFIALLLIRKVTSQFLRSGQLGVSRCSLLGRYGSTTFQLHVFITACSPPDDAAVLHVSGAFLFADLEPPIEMQMVQALAAREWAAQSNVLVLRSPHTDAVWPLAASVAAGNYSNPYLRKFPGHLSAVLKLGDLDARLLEFDLIAKDAFRSFCSFLPRALEAPPWTAAPLSPAAAAAAAETAGPLGQQQRQQLFPAAGVTAGNGAKQCSWLAADAGAAGAEARLGRQQLQQQQRRLNQQADRRRPAYVFVAPFFRITAGHFAALLAHHIDYHLQMGVDRYLVYVESGFLELAGHPQLQALAAAGRLRVVLWEELPHVGAGAAHRSIYAVQNLIYVHMMLSVHHEDAVALMVDTDEYLVTPARTSLEQVLSTCGANMSSPLLVSIMLNRRAGYCSGCTASLPPDPTATSATATATATAGGSSAGIRSIYDPLDVALLKAAHSLESNLWRNKTLAASMLAAAGLLLTPPRAGASNSSVAEQQRLLPPPVHPLALYGRHVADHTPKSVVAVRYITSANPHIAYTQPGLLRTSGDNSCAYVLHLRAQIAARLPSGFMDEQPMPRNCFWPLDEIAAAAAAGGGA